MADIKLDPDCPLALAIEGVTEAQGNIEFWRCEEYDDDHPKFMAAKAELDKAINHLLIVIVAMIGRAQEVIKRPSANEIMGVIDEGLD